jgi:hypothetical protein
MPHFRHIREKNQVFVIYSAPGGRGAAPPADRSPRVGDKALVLIKTPDGALVAVVTQGEHGRNVVGLDRIAGLPSRKQRSDRHVILGNRIEGVVAPQLIAAARMLDAKQIHPSLPAAMSRFQQQRIIPFRRHATMGV